MSKEDNSVSFGVGLLLGVVGGVIAAVLYAPKSGEETREMIKDVPSLYSCHIEYQYLFKHGDCVDLKK